MTHIKAYLLCVCAAAMLLSLTKAIVPVNAVRHVISLCGALLLVLTVIAPLVKLEPQEIAESIARFHMEEKQERTGIKIQNRSILADIIKKECETYILEKAALVDAHIAVQLQLSEEGEYPYPVSVEIEGIISNEKREYLMRLIEQDLGVATEKQVWK